MAEDTPTPRRGRGRPTNEEIAAELGSVTQFAATSAPMTSSAAMMPMMMRPRVIAAPESGFSHESPMAFHCSRVIPFRGWGERLIRAPFR